MLLHSHATTEYLQFCFSFYNNLQPPPGLIHTHTHHSNVDAMLGRQIYIPISIRTYLSPSLSHPVHFLTIPSPSLPPSLPHPSSPLSLSPSSFSLFLSLNLSLLPSLYPSLPPFLSLPSHPPYIFFLLPLSPSPPPGQQQLLVCVCGGGDPITDLTIHWTDCYSIAVLGRPEPGYAVACSTSAARVMIDFENTCTIAVSLLIMLQVSYIAGARWRLYHDGLGTVQHQSANHGANEALPCLGTSSESLVTRLALPWCSRSRISARSCHKFPQACDYAITRGFFFFFVIIVTACGCYIVDRFNRYRGNKTIDGLRNNYAYVNVDKG